MRRYQKGKVFLLQTLLLKCFHQISKIGGGCLRWMICREKKKAFVIRESLFVFTSPTNSLTEACRNEPSPHHARSSAEMLELEDPVCSSIGHAVFLIVAERNLTANDAFMTLTHAFIIDSSGIIFTEQPGVSTWLEASLMCLQRCNHVLATLLPLQLLCCKGFLLRLFLGITYCIGLQQKPLWQIISRPRWRPLILGSLKWPRCKETWWGQLNYEEVLRWVSRSFSMCCRLDCRGQKQSMGPRCSC